MRDQILEKLSKHLQKPIEDEAWLLYLLAQIRKLRERQADQQSADIFPSLTLYCHWALHVRLHNWGTTQVLLRRIIDSISDEARDPLDEFRMLDELMYFTSFRQELCVFLSEQSLSTELCKQDDLWHKFLSLYVRIIEDGDLEIIPRYQDQYGIEKVSFRVKVPDAKDLNDTLPFFVVWEAHLKDGQVLKHDVRPLPGQSKNAIFYRRIVKPAPASEGPSEPRIDQL